MTALEAAEHWRNRFIELASDEMPANERDAWLCFRMAMIMEGLCRRLELKAKGGRV